MIKFFRRIRQNLLLEGKTGKPAWPAGRYLKYAIGEIILVVIGILIALQVNNWNIQSERKIQQIAILNQIDKDFSTDLVDLRENYDTHNRGILAAQRILTAIENDSPYTDSLGGQFGEFGMSRFISTTGAYESLKSVGLEIITNNSLRSKILRIHDELYEALNFFDSGLFLKYTFITESLVEYYDEVSWRAKPLDFEALKKSEEYKTILKTHMYQLSVLQTRLYEPLLDEILETQIEIREEIERLKE